MRTLALAAVLSATTSVAYAERALTCRFEYEQMVARSDALSPEFRSQPLPPSETFTLVFDRGSNNGAYTKLYDTLGTATGKVKVLKGRGRITFLEDVTGDNLFVISVFTDVRFPDGRYPAVRSSHVWWTNVRTHGGDELYLPAQAIGGCR
jgi:hypothetical protein